MADPHPAALGHGLFRRPPVCFFHDRRRGRCRRDPTTEQDDGDGDQARSCTAEARHGRVLPLGLGDPA
ncbi:protein of unknown function [Rhodovastum atsumiense]|nr:protein of unknown function [Rhodovastum atsumiense]